MKLKKGFIVREVGGRSIVISTDPKASFDGMLALNESARFLWDMLSRGAEREALISSLEREYGIDRERAISDTDSLLQALVKLSLLNEDE